MACSLEHRIAEPPVAAEVQVGQMLKKGRLRSKRGMKLGRARAVHTQNNDRTADRRCLADEVLHKRYICQTTETTVTAAATSETATETYVVSAATSAAVTAAADAAAVASGIHQALVAQNTQGRKTEASAVVVASMNWPVPHHPVQVASCPSSERPNRHVW